VFIKQHDFHLQELKHANNHHCFTGYATRSRTQAHSRNE